MLLFSKQNFRIQIEVLAYLLPLQAVLRAKSRIFLISKNLQTQSRFIFWQNLSLASSFVGSIFMTHIVSP